MLGRIETGRSATAHERTVCVIPGDGIGPEVTTAARAVLDHLVECQLVSPVRVEELALGTVAHSEFGDSFPEGTIERLKMADGILVGAFDLTNLPIGARHPLRGLRQGLRTFASLRPSRSFAGIGLAQNVDLLLVREITQGLYSGKEVAVSSDMAFALRIVDRHTSENVAQIALERAARRRGHLTVVHKVSALRKSDSIFIEAVERVAEDSPEVTISYRNVDSCALDLVQHPERFDVILATNAFGDILSDVAAGVTGGIGLAPSACLGNQWSYFEPAHGTAPGKAGQGTANPIGAIRCLAMMMEQWGYEETAATLDQAVESALTSGFRSVDLGGDASTEEITRAVISGIGS